LVQVCRLDHLSVGRSVCLSVYCGKTAEWIWIPFGAVSWVDQGMGVLNGGGYGGRGMGSFGMNLGRPIVSNGDILS